MASHSFPEAHNSGQFLQVPLGPDTSQERIKFTFPFAGNLVAEEVGGRRPVEEMHSHFHEVGADTCACHLLPTFSPDLFPET